MAGGCSAKGRGDNFSNLALGVSPLSDNTVKMSGKLAMAGKCSPEAACRASVPLYYVHSVGGDVVILLGAWCLEGATNCLEDS